MARPLVRSRELLTLLGLVLGCAGFLGPEPSLPTYVKALTLGAHWEWRFQPLVVDLNRDGNPDLVATARLVEPSLRIWLGDGKGAFTPMAPAWTDIGYAALAAGDINGDGFPDIVAASHFGRVQTLLSDGRGGFTERILRKGDGYVAARVADLNGDGYLDLILVGFRQAGVEMYSGDGTGNWTLHTTLPHARPAGSMPGRALVVGDLNHDEHVDLVVAFQRWGVYVYYGDGRGRFAGGSVDFPSLSREFQALALGDVNNDGHSDIVINGTSSSGSTALNGPEVYVGDGRGGWKSSSAGLKALRVSSGGLGLGDLDRDGNLDIVAGGNLSGDSGDGHGLFWFKGDGQGAWRLVPASGLPARGLPVLHGVAVADLDRDGIPEIIALGGGSDGSIMTWRQR